MPFPTPAGQDQPSDDAEGATGDGQTTQTDTIEDPRGYPDTLTVKTAGVTLSVTDYDYDASGRLVQVETRHGAGSTLSRMRYAYAPDGVLADVIAPGPNKSGQEIHTYSSYDRAGLLWETMTGILQPPAGRFDCRNCLNALPVVPFRSIGQCHDTPSLDHYRGHGPNRFK